MNSPGAVFDPRLGGKYKCGSKWRDSKTGCFVKAKPTCPPHYWMIDSQNVGRCKFCNEVRDFGKELKKKLKRPAIKGINPRYTSEQRE